MFERICVPPIEPAETEFDTGLLAEALLFYGEVYLVVGENNLRGLLRQIGPEVLLRLIDDDHLFVRYRDHDLVAITSNKGTPAELYDVGLVTAEKSDLDTAARAAFIDVTGKSGRGRRLASRFCQRVQPIQYAEDITNRITDDMKRGVFIEEYLRRRLMSSNSSRGHEDIRSLEYRFNLLPGRGFALQSNLHLVSSMRKRDPLPDPASVLAHYGTTVANMSIWAQLATEVAVYPRQKEVIAARLEPMLEAYCGGQKHVSAFQDFVFDDAKAIRESINLGRRSFSELLPLLDRSKQFKEWLVHQSPDIDLLKEYHRAVTSSTWVDRLPGKSSRWALFTMAGVGIDALGAGGLGTTAGVGLSAFDTFFLDKLIKGWRPHQFVEGPLKKFVDDEA